MSVRENKMKIFKQCIAVLMVAIAAGCGTPQLTTASSIRPDSEVMYQVESLNKNGALNDLELGLLDSAEFKVLAEETAERATKLGVIRSREDGKFAIQVRRGVLDDYLGYPEMLVNLVGSDDNKTLKLASYLNKLVIVRGTMRPDKSMEVRLVMEVPSIGYVTDLITKGKVAGTAYEQNTKVAVQDVAITLKSLENGNIYRTISKYNGKYSFFRIPAGRYSLTASKFGYKTYNLGEVGVANYRKTQALIPLIGGGAVPSVTPTPCPTKEPVIEPSIAPTVAPSTAPNVEPSVAPSDEPTVTPTAQPSSEPTVCPINPTVWVNTDSGIYHYPSSIWYGSTKHGVFMKECEAKAKGYRASRIS